MRVFGLIGYPLSHSFSEHFFNEKFKREKINNVQYKKFSIKSINDFPEIIKSDNNISGFNVTAPYKEVIIPFLDELDDTAIEVGAVNVVKIFRNSSTIKLIGYNSDIYGFQNSLTEKLNPEIKSGLILGTGGAAKAVAAALNNLNISFQFISRNKSDNVNCLTYNELNKITIQNNLLIVNATPLGIYPEINNKPDIPYEYITDKHYLFDLIYNPSETLFLKEGIKRNAIVQNGLKMLKLQAEKAWEIFNNY